MGVLPFIVSFIERYNKTDKQLNHNKMLFNSIDFAIFMPIVFIIYWALGKNVKIQNFFLLAASYFFYAWWDWRYLSLVLVCSITNYSAGILLMKHEKEKVRKIILTVCCLVCFGVLGVFKYYDFFVKSFVDAFSLFGAGLQAHTLNLILPVGISFYTFHTLSYTIEVYRSRFEPTKDVASFFLFVSIFPLAMAGPIERATNLLPQIYKKRTFDYAQATDGMRQILWGLFKKIMIADRLAVFVDAVYGDILAAEGLSLVLGIIFFTFQLYLDFSAYSDIAIGLGKLLGFSFLRNFKRPYLSTSFGNFWKRWHISLSSWFQDFVYIPLGGNRKGRTRTIINVLIVFAVSGLWHGASWNFVIWGLLNALFMIALDPVLSLVKKQNVVTHVFKSVVVVLCWTLSLVFFRAQGFDTALDCFRHLDFSNAGNIVNFGLNAMELKLSFILIAILLLKEILWEKDETLVPRYFAKTPAVLRWIFYVLMMLSIVYLGQYGTGNENAFIYFQF